MEAMHHVGSGYYCDCDAPHLSDCRLSSTRCRAEVADLDEQLRAARDHDVQGQGPHRLGSNRNMVIFWVLYAALVLALAVGLGLVIYSSTPVQ